MGLGREFGVVGSRDGTCLPALAAHIPVCGQQTADLVTPLIQALVKPTAKGILGSVDLARWTPFKRSVPGQLAAYREFLTLWKDADPDLPVLRQAKAEYAKLQ